MADITPGMIFTDTLRNGKPDALAWVRGNAQNPQLSGIVKFYATPYAGVLVEAEIFGLPNIATQFSSDFYAMHIHEKGDCTMPFDKTGDHYNPTNESHPGHAGDMIPLMGNQVTHGLRFMTNGLRYRKSWAGASSYTRCRTISNPSRREMRERRLAAV